MLVYPVTEIKGRGCMNNQNGRNIDSRTYQCSNLRIYHNFQVVTFDFNLRELFVSFLYF
jgi:hypothetical protein